MNPTSVLICRRFLQAAEEGNFEGVSDAALSPGAAAAGVSRPLDTSSPANSSLVLRIVILLTALFFLALCSGYIRHFTGASEDDSAPLSDSPQRPPTSYRKSGLDASAVNSLPLVAHGEDAKHPMIEDCSICLSEFREGEVVKLIPFCGHVFHPSCLDTWLGTHVTCPLCRTAQLFKRAEGVSLDTTHDKNDMGGEGSYGDSWRNSGSAGGRTCSSSSVANPTVLHRSSTF